MFNCSFCQFTFNTLNQYEKHLYLHRHQKNLNFFCLRENCNRIFGKYPNFQNHIPPNHNFEEKNKNSVILNLKCNVAMFAMFFKEYFSTY